MSSELTSIRSILWPADPRDPRSQPSSDRRNGSAAGRNGNVSNPRSVNGRGRHSERILSFVSSIHGESAIEAHALGFMAKMLVQTTLPHRAQPGTQYTRTDGDVTLSITDIGNVGLPYGAYPRLILVWMTTEALRTGERRLELGRSLSSFMGLRLCSIV